MKRLYISKSLFVQSLVNIKKGLQTVSEYNDAMNKFSASNHITTIGQEWLETSITLLEKCVGDKGNGKISSIIRWWLFEDVEKVIIINKDNNSKIIHVSTPEKLYDYFRKYN